MDKILSDEFSFGGQEPISVLDESQVVDGSGAQPPKSSKTKDVQITFTVASVDDFDDALSTVSEISFLDQDDARAPNSKEKVGSDSFDIIKIDKENLSVPAVDFRTSTSMGSSASSKEFKGAVLNDLVELGVKSYAEKESIKMTTPRDRISTSELSGVSMSQEEIEFQTWHPVVEFISHTTPEDVVIHKLVRDSSLSPIDFLVDAMNEEDFTSKINIRKDFVKLNKTQKEDTDNHGIGHQDDTTSYAVNSKTASLSFDYNLGLGEFDSDMDYSYSDSSSESSAGSKGDAIVSSGSSPPKGSTRPILDLKPLGINAGGISMKQASRRSPHSDDSKVESDDEDDEALSSAAAMYAAKQRSLLADSNDIFKPMNTNNHMPPKDRTIGDLTYPHESPSNPNNISPKKNSSVASSFTRSFQNLLELVTRQRSNSDLQKGTNDVEISGASVVDLTYSDNVDANNISLEREHSVASGSRSSNILNKLVKIGGSVASVVKQNSIAKSLSSSSDVVTGHVREIIGSLSANYFSSWSRAELVELLVEEGIELRGAHLMSMDVMRGVAEEHFLGGDRGAPFKLPPRSPEDIKIREKAASVIQNWWVEARYQRSVKAEQNELKNQNLEHQGSMIRPQCVIESRVSIDDIPDPDNADEQRYAMMTKSSYVVDAEDMEADMDADMEAGGDGKKDHENIALNRMMTRMVELNEPWIRPSLEFAQKYAKQNHPRVGGKGGDLYPFLHTTTGRHCIVGGWGEQLDLWSEGQVCDAHL